MPPEQPTTLNTIIRLIAGLGGFLGRKSDGEWQINSLNIELNGSYVMPDHTDSDPQNPSVNTTTLPFVAPCRDLDLEAPRRWVRLGIADLKSAPGKSLTYGGMAMIMDRKTDLVTAIVTSINAVLRNRKVMLLWATTILGGVLLSVITGLLGLIVIFPIIGHATWHAYRETVDASDWPQRADGDASSLLR